MSWPPSMKLQPLSTATLVRFRSSSRSWYSSSSPLSKRTRSWSWRWSRSWLELVRKGLMAEVVVVVVVVGSAGAGAGAGRKGIMAEVVEVGSAGVGSGSSLGRFARRRWQLKQEQELQDLHWQLCSAGAGACASSADALDTGAGACASSADALDAPVAALASEVGAEQGFFTLSGVQLLAAWLPAAAATPKSLLLAAWLPATPRLQLRPRPKDLAFAATPRLQFRPRPEEKLTIVVGGVSSTNTWRGSALARALSQNDGINFIGCC
jgi:hypothetical protein